MKFKLTVLLATFVVTMGLLLGTSTAQAATVILGDDDNVIGIENLPVFNEITEETILYNVDFVYDTALNVYADGVFDFPDEVNVFLALEAVTDALNANNPRPQSAGPQSTNDFFIGNTVEDGFVVVVGGQIIAGVWDQCESKCLVGVGAFRPDRPFTYADFTVAQDAPPGPATLISPTGTINESNPTYTWNAVENSTWYRLWVNDGAGNNIIDEFDTAGSANCGDGTGQCSVTPPTALADGTFNWWIQTYNEFGYGEWSAGMNFFVDTDSGVLPGKATLISPSGPIAENNPTYTWNAVENATQYRLWVSDSAGDNIINQRNITPEQANCGDGTGECSVTPAEELADDTFEWWILTHNNSGDGQWSDGMFFTVDAGIVGSGDVILDDNDNVIGIENLEVLVDPGDIKVYNVDFVDGSAIDVYGSTLDFDFPIDKDAASALIAVIEALNANDPRPPGAGPQGSDQFFIGIFESEGLVLAVGGENIAGVWGDCESDCQGPNGERIIWPDTSFTWADFTEVAP